MSNIEESQQTESIKILIADGQNLSRSCIQSILEKVDNIKVLHETASGREVIEIAGTMKPDVILLNDNLHDMSGTNVCKFLGTMHNNCHVILLTQSDSESTLIEALAAGARGYFALNTDLNKLINAIQIVSRGDLWIESAYVNSVARCAKSFLIHNQNSHLDLTNATKNSLTTREIEVLTLVAEGKSNIEISGHLKISLHTTKSHIRNILTKLNVSDRMEAAKLLRSASPH